MVSVTYECTCQLLWDLCTHQTASQFPFVGKKHWKQLKTKIRHIFNLDSDGTNILNVDKNNMFVLNFLSYIYYAYFFFKHFFSFVNNTGSSLSCLHPKVKGFVCRDSKSWDTFSNICLQSELLFYYLELRLVIILLIILVTITH